MVDEDLALALGFGQKLDLLGTFVLAQAAEGSLTSTAASKLDKVVERLATIAT